MINAKMLGTGKFKIHPEKLGHGHGHQPSSEKVAYSIYFYLISRKNNDDYVAAHHIFHLLHHDLCHCIQC